jgi:long-chain fatty acid transport protein
MFDVSERLTVGVSYRSKVVMKVSEGLAKISYANETELKPFFGAAIPPLDKGYFKAELPLPSNWNVGVTYKANERCLISGEVQFVGWSAYRSLPVEFYPRNELSAYDQNPARNYKNTRIYRLGTQLAATDRLDYRLGVYLDESPVKDDYLNPETPSMNRLGVTTGFSFRPADPFSADMAFTYITGFGRDGSYTDKSSITKLERKFEGHYDVGAFMASIGVAYRF